MPPDAATRPSLEPDRLARSLAGTGLRAEVLDRSPSTNAELVRRARGGEEPGLVLVAEHQTAGRGRLDRAWLTPPRAALTFSVLVCPDVPGQRWPWLPLLVGHAAVRALAEVVPGLAATLKWPNDVLVAERKLAGILVERVEAPAGPLAVLGIGLNVSSSPAELPVPTATSLWQETGVAPDRTTLLAALLRRLVGELAAWRADDGTALHTAYSAACGTLGQQVRVALPGGEQLSGTAAAVDRSGQLVVEAASGRVSVGAGDVVHVRRGGQ